MRLWRQNGRERPQVSMSCHIESNIDWSHVMSLHAVKPARGGTLRESAPREVNQVSSVRLCVCPFVCLFAESGVVNAGKVTGHRHMAGDRSCVKR